MLEFKKLTCEGNKKSNEVNHKNFKNACIKAMQLTEILIVKNKNNIRGKMYVKKKKKYIFGEGRKIPF